MADYNSQLPVRTENDGDVVIKVADATTPSQQLKVYANGSIDANILATDLDIRDLVFATDKVDVSGSEVSLDAATLAALENITVSATDLDIRDLAFATDKVDVTGSEVSLSAGSLTALENITVQNGAGAAAVNIQDGGNSITVDGTVELGATSLAALENITVSATDLDIRDLSHAQDSIKVGDGTDFLAVNTDGSINVVIQEDVGTEVVNYNTVAAVASSATSNHDVTFASASKLYQVFASGSGKMKIEIQVETAAASGTFTTKAVAFNSTANPNMDVTFAKYVAIPVGARVRVIRTNKDNQSQDVYSTIVGILG